MDKDLIYLDTYVLQKDMRIRLPKSVLKNMKIEKGITKFQIYYDKINESLEFNHLTLKKRKKHENVLLF